jgi:hypothetical protein
VNFRFDINPRWIMRSLLGVIAGLTAADVAVQVLRFGFDRDHLVGLTQFFDSGQERNLPSWFSSAELAFAASLVTLIAVRKSRERDGQRIMWAILAFGFWFLSIDETVQLHESWARGTDSHDITRGLLTDQWVMIGIPVAAAVALLFARFVFTLPTRMRNAIIGAGIFYVWSSLVVEMLKVLYYSTYHVKDFAFQMTTVAGETGEMLAIALFIFALMRYLQDADNRGGTERLSIGTDWQISPPVVARVLIGIVVLLVLVAASMHVLHFEMGRDTVFGLVRVMDLSREGSLPTWYASTQLATAGALLLIIAVRQRRAGDKHAMAWSVLALGFFIMSLDETALIHERWDRFAGFVPREGIFFFRWTAVAIPLCVILFFYFLGLIRSLSARTRNGTILSAAIFLGGAIGMEMITSYGADGNRIGHEADALLNIVENGMELLGIALFIHVLVRFHTEELSTDYQLADRPAVSTVPLPARSL